MNNPTKKPRIGLTFSGGGTRAVAQIGVLKALRENDIRISAVAGNSGGSIVAALYAAGIETEKMLDLLKQNTLYKLYKFGMPSLGITTLDYLEKQLHELIPEDDFSALKIPLFITATNLITGKQEVFSKGTIIRKISASCSIPLIFKPVEIDGQLYADGGMIDNMPAYTLKEDCDFVIGINIMPQVEVPKEELQSLLSIGMRTFDLMIYNNTKLSFAGCNVVIQPTEVYKYHIFNFDNFDEIFEIGYQAALQQMPDIKRRIAMCKC